MVFDLDELDEEDPFEIDTPSCPSVQARPARHYEVWNSDPLFYPSRPPAHWLMVAEIGGDVLVVPLAPPDSGDPTQCRPIGCYTAAKHLADKYREDR